MSSCGEQGHARQRIAALLLESAQSSPSWPNLGSPCARTSVKPADPRLSYSSLWPQDVLGADHSMYVPHPMSDSLRQILKPGAARPFCHIIHVRKPHEGLRDGNLCPTSPKPVFVAMPRSTSRPSRIVLSPLWELRKVSTWRLGSWSSQSSESALSFAGQCFVWWLCKTGFRDADWQRVRSLDSIWAILILRGLVNYQRRYIAYDDTFSAHTKA